MMGISRSASIIILYLMKYKKMTYEDALQCVRKVRKHVKPNPRFEDDLIEIYKDLIKDKT